MDNINDCIKFANEVPVCYFATCDKDQPHVRALGFWFADSSGFYFQTTTFKSFYNELKKNPNCEICFYKHSGIIGTMLRISGNIEFIDDLVLKSKVLEDRPFLKQYGVTPENKDLIIFRIAHGEAHFWTMENNLKPKVYIKF